MSGAGKKRASPGAEETKNPFEPEISDEEYQKLEQCRKDILRVELANGAFVSLYACRKGEWNLVAVCSST